MPPQPGHVVPIVPAAVIFDLGRGGRVRQRARTPPSARQAYAAASTTVAEGCVGAGTGTKAGGLKGGVGTASTVAARRHHGRGAGRRQRGRLGRRPAHRRAVGGPALREPGDLPTLRRPDPADAGGVRRARRPAARRHRRARRPRLVVVATDATLTKAQCAKVAGLGHDGLARALNPVHTMLDGDTVFALATGARPAPDLVAFQHLLGAAGDVVTRSVARAMVAAESTHELRSYRDVFPSAFG